MAVKGNSYWIGGNGDAGNENFQAEYGSLENGFSGATTVDETFQLNTWYHLTSIHDDESGVFMIAVHDINGDLVDFDYLVFDSEFENARQNDDPLTIGFAYAWSDAALNGLVDEFRISGFYDMLKRLMDILGGLLGVLVLVFFLPWIAALTIIDDGFPVFYLQERLSKGARPYNIIKFRTMRKDAEAQGEPQLATEDDDRATRVGRILRKTHLDELPQFINVLRGEMSLVGPRAERR